VAAPSNRRRYCLLDFGVQLLEHQFVTEIDGVGENLSVRASVALDDNAIQSQKYTSIGRFQLFLKVFVPLASTRSRTSQLGTPNAIPLARGDRITTVFAALHKSVAGTKRM
jgi:hypothetical protein